jgi:hypothetical protein
MPVVVVDDDSNGVLARYFRVGADFGLATGHEQAA